MLKAIVGDCGSAMAEEYISRLRAIRFEAVGYVERLVISPGHDRHECVPEIRVVPGVGVAGDHAWKQWWKGRRLNGRQISAMNTEVLDAIDTAYDLPGDNLIVRGFDLATVCKGETIRVGDVILVATGASHKPCSTFAMRTDLSKMKAIAESCRRGTMFDATREGRIRVGDPVEKIFVGQT